MPRALYKFMRDPKERNPNPLVATPTRILQASKQVTDYLLCGECEDLFSRNGERWVCGHCWRSETDFPIQTTLRAATPLHTNGTNFSMYSGAAIPDVDVTALAYFAASVMWRGAVHQWTQYGHTPDRLGLGPFREELRQFLVGNTAFPQNIVLIVSVSTTVDTERNAIMLFPWLSEREDTHHRYAFVIPGVTFQVMIGKRIPASRRNLCMVHSAERYMFMSERRDDDVLAKMGELLVRTLPQTHHGAQRIT